MFIINCIIYLKVIKNVNPPFNRIASSALIQQSPSLRVYTDTHSQLIFIVIGTDGTDGYRNCRFFFPDTNAHRIFISATILPSICRAEMIIIIK